MNLFSQVLCSFKYTELGAFESICRNTLKFKDKHLPFCSCKVGEILAWPTTLDLIGLPAIQPFPEAPIKWSDPNK